MAWSAPATAVTGDVITASFWNTNGRDNLNQTAPAKVTTAGDIVYATAANALARLGIGTTGYPLTAGASAPAWARLGAAGIGVQPACKVKLTVAQSHTTSGNWEAVDFDDADSEIFDTDTMHNPASNPSRITATTAGIYLVIGQVSFAPNATGDRGAYIADDGGTVLAYAVHPAASASFSSVVNIAGVASLAASGYVRILATQGSGGALNMQITDTTLAAYRLGPAS